MHHRTPRLSALAVGIAGVLASAQAAAVETQLEEIVVTARQREERIEDVPVTVQAFTAATIESAGIERPSDFIALTPGVAQVQTAEAGDLQVVIRGINTGRDAETNFALVVDGVLQTNPNALNAELNGVTQIEVLKGPQGALYGRNALAGALIVTTRKPGEEFEADVGAGYGTDNSYKANIWLGGPIGGSTRGSLTAYYRNTDGQWDNDLLDCDDCVDFFEEMGASGRLMFDVGGGTVDLKGRVSQVESGAINFNAAFAQLGWSIEQAYLDSIASAFGAGLRLLDYTADPKVRGWTRIMCTSGANHPYVQAWWPDAHILGYEHGFVNQAADIMRVLGGEKPEVPIPDFADAYETQRVLEAAVISAKERCAIPMKQVK